ncbi:zinc finger, C4 type [Ancylostoma caninum]|uniref:Zinc finger, C4 type n=1 Tax=Ancylostoma caninum TaxID=29170 RepID=A0A368GSC7_ANCCA|nr:zinc finger, C4 type [Ancylostoma caninum]
MDPVKNRSESICQICGSPGAQIYYRAISCGSCKAFFVRAIKRSAAFVCDNNGKCIVNKESTTGRKACKACRFMRCIQANMREEGMAYSLVTMVVKQGLHICLKLPFNKRKYRISCATMSLA